MSTLTIDLCDGTGRTFNLREYSHALQEGWLFVWRGSERHYFPWSNIVELTING